MSETDTTLDDAIDRLNSIDGILASESLFKEHGAFVEVLDEGSVGQLYKAVRELDAEPEALTRDGLSGGTVLDGWVNL